MNEVGIYRVSGSASDLQKLKKSFESSKRTLCGDVIAMLLQ